MYTDLRSDIVWAQACICSRWASIRDVIDILKMFPNLGLGLQLELFRMVL
jgi:hypothetical protein